MNALAARAEREHGVALRLFALPSALRHGVRAVSGAGAGEHSVVATDVNDDTSARQFRPTIQNGFDPDGRVLELVILRFDTGNELLIHAVKAGPHYLDLLL